MHLCSAGLCLLTLICLMPLTTCSSCSPEIRWHRVSTHHHVCINESVPLQQQPVSNELSCLLAASSLTRLLVAQFNAVTGSCSVFHYQSVCHLINATGSTAQHAQHSCSVFVNAAAKSRMQFQLKLSSKFTGVWLMSEDEHSSRGNSVCGRSERWQADKVEWTQDGVKLGAASKMTLENADFGDFSLGFTWLLRLKRQPRAGKHFMSNCDCTGSTLGLHMSENMAAGDLQFATARQVPNPRVRRAENLMTNDANVFINIGVTGLPASTTYRLFYNTGFVAPDVDDIPGSSTPAAEYGCFHLASRCKLPIDKQLTGTVRAVAIANALMTEAEINEFFDLLG